MLEDVAGGSRIWLVILNADAAREGGWQLHPPGRTAGCIQKPDPISDPKFDGAPRQVNYNSCMMFSISQILEHKLDQEIGSWIGSEIGSKACGLQNHVNKNWISVFKNWTSLAKIWIASTKKWIIEACIQFLCIQFLGLYPIFQMYPFFRCIHFLRCIQNLNCIQNFNCIQFPSCIQFFGCIQGLTICLAGYSQPPAS